MNRSALIASMALGLLGAGLLWVYMVRYEREARGGEPVLVLVARQDLPMGTALTPESLAAQPIPEAYVDGRNILATAKERVLGIRLRNAIKAGERILWTDLASNSGDDRGLSTLVRPGYRAFTMLVDASSTFAGLLQPGDRVDVLHTTERNGRPVTLTLLQNVLVLAIGNRTANLEGVDEEASNAEEITVSVTPSQAQLIAEAQNMGSLRLVMRAPDDIGIVEGMPETTPEDVVRAEKRRRVNRRFRPIEPEAPSGPTAVE